MFSLRAHAIIFFAIFAAIIVVAVAGNIAEAYGVSRPPPALQTALQIVFLGLTLALGLSFIPLMVKFVLQGQVWAGNQDRPFIKTMIEHQTTIIWVIWGLIVAGLVVAIPAAIKDGFLSDNTTAAAPSEAVVEGPSLGTLVARPGMTVDEVSAQSTLKLQRQPNQTVPGQSAIAGGGIFEYEVAGTGFKFENCRYYFMSTYTHDPARIESISIGTSRGKLSRADLERANAALRAQLTAGGWLTGREEYRTEEDRQLHGGASRGEEGQLWLKSDIALHLMARRMDDAAPGEDSATAGEWIQYVDLWEKRDYPGIERYVFAPPAK